MDDKPLRTKRRIVAPVEQVDLLSVITLVLWLAALAIGIAGLVLTENPLPVAASMALPPTQVLDVQLDSEPMPQTATLVAQAPPAADQPMEAAPPAMPTLAAAPSAAIAFAMPVSGPTQLSDAAHAGLVRADVPKGPAPPVRQFVYGQGEGWQPKPIYPPEARLDDQQGDVVVRWIVDRGGAIRSVELYVPSPWPLLNNVAVETVRDKWRFAPGPVRSYQYTFHFQLNPF